MNDKQTILPLAGVRVADFSRVVAGPYSTYLLARMGAEVIKIEGSDVLDHTREVGPYTDETRSRNRSGYFNAVNAGKKSVTLNLQDSAHSALAREIAVASDIVVESFLPGTMERFGLGYEQLSGASPSLVMVSCSGFGRTGPMRSHSAYMNTIAAFVGLTSLNSFGAEQPTPVGATFSDLVAGTSIALGALLALKRSRATGQGAHIDLSMAEASMALMSEPFVEELADGGHNTSAPWAARLRGVYRTAGDDKWIAISIRTDEQLQALVQLLGNPPSIAIASAHYDLQGQQRAEIDRQLSEWARGFDNIELTQILQSAGVPALPSSDPEDVVKNPHFLQRGAIAPQEYRLEPGRVMPNLPWHFVNYPSLDTSLPAPPMLGEHNRSILSTLTTATGQLIGELEKQARVASRGPG